MLIVTTEEWGIIGTRKRLGEQIRIILDGLRGEDSIAELYRGEGISQGIY